jgi:uncharacterized protein (UPF0261 family)
MKSAAAIAVVGTFDSKGEEHLFLKASIERRGLPSITIHIGTKGPSPFTPDWDLFRAICTHDVGCLENRDEAIQAILERAQHLVRKLHQKEEICGIISAGGGTGTYLGTGVMRVLPLGVPKVMVSTVASRDMAAVVGTKDITMIHSVVDLLGINSISGKVLDRAAGAVCGMAQSKWTPENGKHRIALTLFGFITVAAENIKRCLEETRYEVIPFHANGTGGMAMEELAAEGHFHGILDLATHELADALMNGYCGGIGPGRLEPSSKKVPRLVAPGGLDCAVLEFTRDNIPEQYKHRKIFFYDFRSAIRLDIEESQFLAKQLAAKMNQDTSNVRIVIPRQGWSEADRLGGTLYDPEMREQFVRALKAELNPRISVKEVDCHINDLAFARIAAGEMDQMLQEKKRHAKGESL